MQTRKYKRVDANGKIQALQDHFMNKKSVSDICENIGIKPSVFYSWQRELFMRGASLFDQKRGRRAVDRSQDRIAELEAKLTKKDAVIAELLEEHVTLKKTLGLN